MARADRVACVESPVVLLGETGTGKSTLARHIHDRGARGARPFVAVNCAAIPSELLEAELFGAVRGSHSTAFSDSTGLIQEADGGTVFLDEIGDMPLAHQVKLFHVLDSGTVRSVGAARSFKADVRFIAATNRDLARATTDGSFRADLFYRLAVHTIVVPPLRDRPDDIVQIANTRWIACGGSRISDSAITRLLAHSWPGNIRELLNTIQRSWDLTHCEVLDASAIEFVTAPHDGARRAGSFSAASREFQQEIIKAALFNAGGNIAGAARLLKMKASTLKSRIVALEIDITVFCAP